MSGTRRTLIAALLTLLLSACGTGGPRGGSEGTVGPGGTPAVEEPGSPADSGAPRDPAPEPDSGPPLTEVLGTVEEPAATQDAGVSVAVAGLPIGGGPGDVSPEDPYARCIHVSWTGPIPIPPTVHLQITAIEVQPEGFYELGGSGCAGDGTGCLNHPGVLDDFGQCDVAVRQLVETPDGYGSLGVTAARIDCAPQDASTCAAFESQLLAAGEPERIEWDDAVITDTGTPDPAISTTGTDTSDSGQGG